MFSRKTLYGTFLCLAILASSAKFQSSLYKTKKKQIKNFNRAAISWYLRKQVGIIACPYVLRLRRFPAIQKNKYRVKIKKMNWVSDKFLMHPEFATHWVKKLLLFCFQNLFPLSTILNLLYYFKTLLIFIALSYSSASQAMFPKTMVTVP